MGQRVPPYQQFGAARVVPPPGAFLQATQDGEAALLAAVREAVAGGKKGIDLFSGCGTFSLPLLDQAEMHGVEGERDMVTAMMEGWRAAGGLRKLTSESRDLFRNPLLAPELRADFAVIDPPRAGAQAQTSELAQSDIPKIAFVSCNPVTFARDAKLLVEGGYVLKWVKLVDQFRWSTHIELAAAFERV